MNRDHRVIIAPLLFLLFLAACVGTLSGDWASLFSLDAISTMGAFASGFVPPALDASFLARTGWAALETLAISVLGTLLAMIGGLVLALPAAGRWGAPSKWVARGVLNVARAIPELVWASMIVVAAGLGPFAGTLALAFHTTGVLGRLFAESLENVPPEANEALRRNGVASTTAFWYSTLPQALPQLTSYTLYRWENNIRAATILGVVGAGGLGQMLYFHLSLFQTHEAATVLFAMIALVGMVDVLSNVLRRRMA
ncbi:MAG: phosphonate ABC transporter, permease protein PhnE [Betaproteobacteria bacterium]